jgi:hypothetical protein
VKHLDELVSALLDGGIPVGFMRDPTRGGLAAVLHELAEASGSSMILEESAVPLSEPVRGAAELLGLDPLHVANEGELVAVVPAEHAEPAVGLLRAHALGRAAAVRGPRRSRPHRAGPRPRRPRHRPRARRAERRPAPAHLLRRRSAPRAVANGPDLRVRLVPWMTIVGRLVL